MYFFSLSLIIAHKPDGASGGHLCPGGWFLAGYSQLAQEQTGPNRPGQVAQGQLAQELTGPLAYITLVPGQVAQSCYQLQQDNLGPTTHF